MPSRPNTTVLFPIFDPSSNKLSDSPSPFIISGWRDLLYLYPGDLPETLINILDYGALLGYEGPDQRIVSRNHSTVNISPDDIKSKLEVDIAQSRIVIALLNPSDRFISSPLGLVPKNDGGFRRIHDLSYPLQSSVNTHIDKSYGALHYTHIEHILDDIVKAGRHCVILKRDIKEAFRNIPVAPQMQWLLGFQWNDNFYMERCLPFGLATAPFIFNLFAEAFHWILQSWLDWKFLSHYLDDFILIIPPSPSLDSVIHTAVKNYIDVTDLLGIPRNDKKDQCGTALTVLGYEIDTNTFILRVPRDKLSKAYNSTLQALSKPSLNLHEAESLAGFLGFCAPAVQLGRVFLRSLWSFTAAYPEDVPKFTRRRIPADLRCDLTWWHDLLPQWNGTCFFDTKVRNLVSLYTDASGVGLGGYFMLGPGPFKPIMIPMSNAFSIPFIQSTDTSFDINIYEMEAIKFALRTWGPIWASSKVMVFTDSKSSELGLIKQTLRSPANAPLRETLLLAAAYDIILEPAWIQGSTNTFADALSRLEYDTIADLCPHWQGYSALIPHRHFMSGKKT